MQQVSTEWKKAQLDNIVPMSLVEISYNIGDPESQADATTSAPTPSYGKVGQIIDSVKEDYSTYATLEMNKWVLDGSMDIYEDNPAQDTGYISTSVSGRDCIFTSHPVVTINFSKVFTNIIPGLTITWSNTFDECARDFKVTAYNGTAVVATTTVTDNTKNKTVVNLDINNYNKIEIEVLEWCLPYSRARIEQIQVGIDKIFDKSDLIGYTHEEYVDVLSGDLPKNSITFEIDNVLQEWNPDAPLSVYKYLIQRQEIKVRYGYKINGKVEWIKAGNFYMSEWNTPQNGITATFTARDLLEFMSDKFKTTSTSITLYNLALEALNQAHLPLNPDGSVKWIVDPSLNSITVTIPQDFDYTIADTLKLIANAGKCVIYQDREGNLNIKPASYVLTDYIIDRFNSYKNAEYELTKELKAVDVNDGMGKATNAPEGETQTLDNDLIQSSTVANSVATWVKDILKNRNLISGEFRADPRLDALDTITISNKYASKKAIITEVKYSYKGAFKGTYEGRVLDA